MFEPKTLSVPELAERWKMTTRQVLEAAAQLRIHLLFDFDGLVIDDTGEKLMQYDLNNKREHARLTEFIESAEAKFKRRIAGLLSPWESLADDEAVELQIQVRSAQSKIQDLQDVFDVVTRERLKWRYRGPLMASPETVDELKRIGSARHPFRAYKPDGPFSLQVADGMPALDGPIVRLEAAGTKLKEWLEIADMVALMADVKAIEAAAKPQQLAPSANTEPDPITISSDVPTVDDKANTPWWQEKYDIMEMAKNKGASLKAKGSNPSNAAISKEIANHIANAERSKGSVFSAPNHDTIRGLLTGWRWKAE